MVHYTETTKDNIVIVHLIGVVSTNDVTELGSQVLDIFTKLEDKKLSKKVKLKKMNQQQLRHLGAEL